MSPTKRTTHPRQHPAATAAQTGYIGGAVIGTTVQLAQGWELVSAPVYVLLCLLVAALGLILVERISVHHDDDLIRAELVTREQARLERRVLAERLRKLPNGTTRRTRRG